MRTAVGEVIVWFKDRGYGFVLENFKGTYQKYFLHASSVMSGKPKDGSTVRFLASECSKGLIALKAEVIDGGAK
jgi:cold shock CspA family protein